MAHSLSNGLPQPRSQAIWNPSRLLRPQRPRQVLDRRRRRKPVAEARSHQLKPQPQARPLDRIEAIDLSRGIAIGLMILSHGVKGLLPFESFPAWGLVPVHLMTKVSSSLFILVFGIALTVTQLPSVGTSKWPEKRRKLLVRGLVVFFWYKVLTIVEMFNLYSRQEVLDTLSYKAFPVYSEILDFYALALLWVPFALPLWKKAGRFARLGAIIGSGVAATWISRHFDFWGIEALKALSVEHEQHYTWGQLSRAPLIFAGLFIGDAIAWSRLATRNRLWVSGGLCAAGLASLGLLVLLVVLAGEGLSQTWVGIARNAGKHPPQLDFMLFSVGGALLVLGLSLLGGRFLARLLKPFAILGTNALQSFVCHLFVLFVFYRYLFGLMHGVSYQNALWLTLLLFALTTLWIKTLTWVEKNS